MVILTNPDYNGIISNTIVSLNTRKNLVIINKILKKISRAQFFDSVYESNYTIFNTYLIEIMPTINYFFENLTKVKLPKVIEDLIMSNKKFETLQSTDYFKNNEDQLINLQSISFSIVDVLLLYKTVKNNLDLFAYDSSLKKAIEKIEIQEQFLQNKLKEYSNMNKKKYFIVHNLINNPSKIELLYPKQNRFTFSSICDGENSENYESMVNRMKFCVKTILRNLNEINTTIYSDFLEVNTSEKLFNALNKIIQLEDFADNMTNDKIPLGWYALYLTSNAKNLKKYYSKLSSDADEDSELLEEINLNRFYDDLQAETKKEIELLNNKSNLIITKYGMNLRCAEKMNETLKKEVIKVKHIEKFVRIEKFIQNGKISVCLRSRNNGNINIQTKDEEHSLNSVGGNKSSIMICRQENCIHHKYNFLDKAIDGKVERKIILHGSKELSVSGKPNHIRNKSSQIIENVEKLDGHCDTFEEFIYTFQLFNEIKEDIIFGDQRNKIFETMEFYLSIVKERLLKDQLFINIYNCETITEVIDDIENYLLKKIYKNVFPEDELHSDSQLYEQCMKFRWITPQHLEISEKYINENLWQSAIELINCIDSEKSPVEKLKCVHSAYKILNNCISFCSGKQEYAGLDDIFPIFIYVILKAQPKRMFSNMHYIKTFMSPGRLLTTYGFLLTQIEGSVNFILEINQKMLKISEEEYHR